MKNRPLHRRLGAALCGVREGLASERSLRTQVFGAALVVVALGYRHARPIWWAMASLACGGVLAAELLNTALEKLVDHLHPGPHDAVRILKDCAAGAVLVTSMAALGVAAAYVVSELES